MKPIAQELIAALQTVKLWIVFPPVEKYESFRARMQDAWSKYRAAIYDMMAGSLGESEEVKERLEANFPYGLGVWRKVTDAPIELMLAYLLGMNETGRFRRGYLEFVRRNLELYNDALDNHQDLIAGAIADRGPEYLSRLWDGLNEVCFAGQKAAAAGGELLPPVYTPLRWE